MACRVLDARKASSRYTMTRGPSSIACRRTVAFFTACRKARLASRRNGSPWNGQWLAFANLPLRERLNNTLADAMFAIDEAVQMCELEGDTTHEASLLAVQIHAAYDQVNCIMKTISN
jgi:hypothetical protein